MQIAFFVYGLPVMLLLHMSWMLFTGRTYRQPHVQAIMGLVLIVTGMLMKSWVANVEILPIPGWRDGLRIVTQLLDATLAPIGGGIFAAATLLRGQLLSARDTKRAKMLLQEDLSLYRSFRREQRILWSRHGNLPGEEFDTEVDRLARAIRIVRDDMRGHAQDLRGTDAEITDEELHDMLQGRSTRPRSGIR